MEEDSKRSEFVPLHGIMTHVLKYGNSDQSKYLYLIIPGNPGIIDYYDRFMQVLYRNCDQKIPVWGISHAGHVTVPNKSLDVEKASYSVCSLEGQIKHKVKYIKDHIPADVKLILIGHSIGCYMIMRILDEIDHQRVVRCFQLFPTIERMAQSPKGQVATPMLKYLRWLGTAIVHGASYLSPFVQYRLLLWYFSGRKIPECVYNASINLFDPFCVSNVMYMANLEMQQVAHLDDDLVERHLPKMSFYYGEDDHWCPKSYYFDMKKKFPHGDIRLCENGYDHAFVLEASDEMGDIVWEWLQSDLAKLES